ncbi:hypothetical protein GOBAR_DD07245 [Gossypium barbadense]|nr:hypothetical protein GOBAR_DD07245 [Gossypium barbadense]
MITLQARNSVKTSSDRDDFTSSVNMSNHMAQTSLQETLRKNVMEPRSSPCNRNRMTHEERMLQINELDEWWTHVKEKLRIHDAKPKRRHDEYVDGKNQFKVGDKVLLDKMDPRMTTSELDANESNPFTVLNIFSYGTIEVTNSELGTFKVNSTRLKPYFDHRINNEK